MTYRRLHGIPDDWGTAVNVQAMVFGNMGETSATGVAFTRNPSTGERALFGEFLVNAQGEDVVAGIRTPQNISEAARIAAHRMRPRWSGDAGDVRASSRRSSDRLEHHYRDMQDHRVHRRARQAVDAADPHRQAHGAGGAEDRGRHGRGGADQPRRGGLAASIRLRSTSCCIRRSIPKRGRDSASRTVCRLRRAPPPARSCSTADEAEKARAQGEAVILVRIETSPEDIHGMHAAKGILTDARRHDQPCRGGGARHGPALRLGRRRHLRSITASDQLTARRQVLRAGEIITIDGSTGEVMRGAVPTIQPELSGDFATLMGWADAVRRLKVRANAETPDRCPRCAREFGAEGIGLCRTEHMFFEADRIGAMREMILADDRAGRRAALAKLLPMQRAGLHRAVRDHGRACR